MTISSLATAHAQSDLRYFGETSHYLRGAFRYFWESRGGVGTFGFPVTEEFVRKSDPGSPRRAARLGRPGRAEVAILSTRPEGCC